MRSVVGPTISQKAGVFYITDDYEDALQSYELAKKMYPDFTIVLADLSKAEGRIAATNIDPDLGDFERGYAIIILVPG
ncbi:MAG: hypothetical protein MPF33_03320 [Candidatus Aramenus sp.]|jgi:hypothetical protein|nr:hypothetical protein [Candidatus Aramenus sp.]